MKPSGQLLKKIIIIGGGISGLITSIQLVRTGIPVTLIERKSYPFHRVCGEYISAETIPFLNSLGLFPDPFSPPAISRLQLSSVNGKSAFVKLDLGGFGISRHKFDHFLFQEAASAGVHFILNTTVDRVHFQDDHFRISAAGQEHHADVVIGSHGKRSVLDVSMGRDFIRKRSPYLAIKYHVRTDHPPELIGLHNFKGGYCGISRVEDGKTNLCYLTHRDNLKEHGSIPEMEEAVLFRNPIIESIFRNSDFLFDKPETINEISFETKKPVDQHILMAGDAAGMITPLCGNGMAMAMHASRLIAGCVRQFCEEPSYDRARLERDYSAQWRAAFAKRLWTGRHVQRLFGDEWSSNLAVGIAQHVKPLANWLVSKTHGIPF